MSEGRESLQVGKKSKKSLTKAGWRAPRSKMWWKVGSREYLVRSPESVQSTEYLGYCTEYILRGGRRNKGDALILLWTKSAANDKDWL